MIFRCLNNRCLWRNRLLHLEFIMSSSGTCTLYPLDNSYERISLPHCKTVILGRNPFTKIIDKRCSRSQVEVEADVEQHIVNVKHVGANKAGCNGLALEKNSCITLRHNDTIELILGYFIYRIKFDPLPSEANERKRQLVDVEVEESNSKRHCSGSDENHQTGVAVTCLVDSTSPQKTMKGWETIDNGKLLIFSADGCEAKSKIAAFDLDGTIIATKSGKVFPVNNDDWRIIFPEVPKKLKKLWEEGYKIVFLTNQAGIGKGKVNVKDFKKKVEGIAQKLDVPLQVFVSTGKGIYRKPAPGMWDAVVEKNLGLPITASESFYCGDAAGRPVNWAPKKKKDFSVADRLLALNLNLKFHTPEEFFLKEREAPYNLPEFIPSKVFSDVPLIATPGKCLSSSCTEVVVMVGSPGSGKSHFAKIHLVPKGYLHVNRDTLGSWQKCVSELEKGLSQSKSVVVDNTSPDKESRRRFLEVARRYKVPCRCFVLNTSLGQAKHNNRFRELIDNTHQEVTDMVINSYMKKYQEPSSDEGFDEIVKVNWVPKFVKPQDERLYKMFLLEK